MQARANFSKLYGDTVGRRASDEAFLAFGVSFFFWQSEQKPLPS